MTVDDLAPRTRWVLGLGSLLVALAGARVAYGFLTAGTSPRYGDMRVYVEAIAHRAEHGSLYTYVTDNGLGFTYPPIAADLLLPLSWLPAAALDPVWALVNVLAVISLGWSTTAALPVTRTGHRALAAAGVSGLLALSVQVQSGLLSGNVSLVLTALCLADAGGLVPTRVRGALVGVASAVKLTPLAFVPLLAALGERRAAVRALVVAGALTVLGVVLHVDDSVRYWTDAIFDSDRIGDPAFLGNQSMMGMLARLGVEGPVRSGLWVLLGGAVLVTAWWRVARSPGCHPVAATVTVGCGSAVASPVSWPFHQVWLPIAGVLLLVSGRPLLVGLGAIVTVTCLVWPSVVSATTALPVGLLVDNWQLLACAVLAVVGPLSPRPTGHRARDTADVVVAGPRPVAP